MKKFTIFTIAFALVCALAFGISVNAADNQAYKAGDTVTVEFTLGDTMRNGDYTITYNPDALTFEDVTPAASKNDDPVAGKVVVSFNSAKADKVVATFTAKTITEDASAQVSLVPQKFRNTSGNLVDVQTASKSVTVSAQPTENEVVENDVVKNDVVENNVVENDVVENDVVENNVVENEVKTPSTTNTTKNDNDDKKTYDQTGANVAIVAVIALAVVLGSAIVIKRK